MESLPNLINSFNDLGCDRVYVKVLSANDNSKNQVYLGGSFDILNILPIGEIQADDSGDWERSRFKASLDFSWISDERIANPAPKAQLILYPKYPEVRFSGFLVGCKAAPSELMTQRLPGRLLFFGVAPNGRVFGYVTHPAAALSAEFFANRPDQLQSVFAVINLRGQEDAKSALIHELKRIHLSGWINSRRLDSKGRSVTCNAPQCGGYTLEAELGITPNGYSEPDYMGWEVKQYGVDSFDRTESKIVTLMTPEPNGGDYHEKGVDYFLRKYGYADKNGKIDRLNFGGIHKVGIKTPITQLRMVLDGYDPVLKKITKPSGSVALVSISGEVAASWSFTGIIDHWKRKHAKAAYVPSMKRTDPSLQYSYGSRVMLSQGTRFDLLLDQIATGTVYYDPGIKMENATTDTPKIKRRSQFRVKSGNLRSLYITSEVVDLIKVGRP